MSRSALHDGTACLVLEQPSSGAIGQLVRWVNSRIVVESRCVQVPMLRLGGSWPAPCEYPAGKGRAFLRGFFAIGRLPSTRGLAAAAVPVAADEAVQGAARAPLAIAPGPVARRRAWALVVAARAGCLG